MNALNDAVDNAPQDPSDEHAQAATAVHRPADLPPNASPEDLRAALDRAFSYRGDVTITLDDASTIDGYVFDRRSDGPALADCSVRVLRAASDVKLSIPYDRIRALAFTGKDCAAGKSFETWIRKYKEMKSSGLAASQ